MDAATQKDPFCAQKVCEICTTSFQKPHKNRECSLRKHYCRSCLRAVADGTICDKLVPVERDRFEKAWNSILREEKRKERIKAEKRTMRSLVELCVKMIAPDPQALIYLASHGELPEATWELIGSFVPNVVGKRYRKELEEYQRVNGIAMYTTLGKVFGRFCARGNPNHVDCRRDSQNKRPKYTSEEESDPWK